MRVSDKPLPHEVLLPTVPELQILKLWLCGQLLSFFLHLMLFRHNSIVLSFWQLLRPQVLVLKHAVTLRHCVNLLGRLLLTQGRNKLVHVVHHAV